MAYYYGLLNKEQAIDYAKAACDCLGHGKKNAALNMLVETAVAETHLGKFKDPTVRYAGAGVGQTDESTFDWLQTKYGQSKHADKIMQSFGIPLDQVKYVELETSPLLSFIFCRLRYLVLPEEIPQTRAERAQYWKTHYNTSLGDGTVEHYMHLCSELLD